MSGSDDLLALFQEKRAELGTEALANALRINASAVRMVCTGHYPNPARVLGPFAKQFVNVIACPYTEQVLERHDCTARSTAPRPFGGESKLRWWLACQPCEHKGKTDETQKMRTVTGD